MPKPATLFVPRLRSNERERFNAALKRAKNPAYRDRLRAILWSESGMKVGEIARLLGKHSTTAASWIKDYKRFGFKALKVGKSTGRPPLIDQEGRAALSHALSVSPRDLGYPFTRWSAWTLAGHLHRETHVLVHPDTVRRLMRRMGYRYNRPKLSLKHRQDRRLVKRARRQRNAALKKASGSRTVSSSCSRTRPTFTSIQA
jgi:transposase